MPNQALEIAAKFLRHLNVEQLEARIGMAWGEVRFAYNEAIGRKDIEGDVVNLAARLEPLAPLGGVLLSKEFGALEINEDVGELISVKRKIEKDTGDWMAGANLDFYEFRFRKN